METQGERLKHFVESQNIRISVLEKYIGLGNGTIYKAIKENRGITERVVEKIEKFYPLLNKDWLLHGKGEMLRSGGASLITNEDWATTAAKNMLNEAQEDYSNHLWTAPANENDTTQTLRKKLRQRDFVIEGLKRELLHAQEILRAKEEIIELLKKKG